MTDKTDPREVLTLQAALDSGTLDSIERYQQCVAKCAPELARRTLAAEAELAELRRKVGELAPDLRQCAQYFRDGAAYFSRHDQQARWRERAERIESFIESLTPAPASTP